MKKHIYNHLYSYRSDIGKVRKINQDAARVLVNDNGDVLLLICDGLGGHNKGEFASKLAVDEISSQFKKRKFFFNQFFVRTWLYLVINKTNRKIYDYAEKNAAYKGMGTTVVALLIHNNKLVVLNIGDSRAYILKDDKLEKLSEDQSYVDYLKRSGQLNEEEAKASMDKNILLSALGTFPSTSFNIKSYRYNNEALLLCSDGLFNNIEEDKIADIISGEKNPDIIINSLIFKANLNGGDDNISAIYYKREKR